MREVALRSTLIIALMLGISGIIAVFGQQANLNEHPEAAARLKARIAAMNVPIAFYAVVLDQDGQPLKGVKVTLRVQQPYFDPIYFAKANYRRFERTTGVDGKFSLDGVTGKNVEIETMAKDGFEAEPNVEHVYGPVGGSLDNPMTFKMWRKDTKVPLIMGHKAFHIVPDGSPYVINFTRDTIGRPIDHLGDLRISIKIGTVVSNRDFDWSLELKPINGGLLEERQASSPMFRAPANGYTNIFNISHKIGDQSGRSEGTFRFFLKLRGGLEYGRCSIDVVDYIGVPTRGPLHIDYAINPTGSDILR